MPPFGLPSSVDGRIPTLDEALQSCTKTCDKDCCRLACSHFEGWCREQWKQWEAHNKPCSGNKVNKMKKCVKSAPDFGKFGGCKKKMIKELNRNCNAGALVESGLVDRMNS